MNCCQRHSLGRLCGIEIEVARHHGGPICIGLWTSEPSLFGSLGWKFLGFVAPGAIRLWLRPPWFWCFSSSIGQSEPIKITQPKWGTYEKPRQATCPRIIDDEHDEQEESVIKSAAKSASESGGQTEQTVAQRRGRTEKFIDDIVQRVVENELGTAGRGCQSCLAPILDEQKCNFFLGQVWASASWTSWTDMCLIQSLKHLDGLIASLHHVVALKLISVRVIFNFSTFWAKDLRQKCEQVREEFSARRGAFEGVFGRFSTLPLGIWIACHKFMGIRILWKLLLLF